MWLKTDNQIENEAIRVEPYCTLVIFWEQTRAPRETAGVHSQRDDLVNRQQERGHLRAKERGLGRNLTCQHIDFGLPASSTLGKINVFFFLIDFCCLYHSGYGTLLW